MAEKLIGCKKPRIFTPPLRPLTRATSRGYEVADFAEAIGEPLLPWQKWAVIHAMETHPDGTYRFRVVLILVARQNGKSSLKRTVSLWRLFIDGARLVVGSAQDIVTAKEQWRYCIDTIQSCSFLKAELDKVSYSNGDEYFRLVNGARYKITAANDKAGRGLSADEVTFDEIRSQRTWAAWASLSKTTMARPNPQIWCVSNAGGDNSIVLNHLRDAAISERDETIGIFEWSAPDNCDLDDREAWRQANPGLGHTINETSIRSAMATDPPAKFRTEVLCQRVASLDGAVDLEAWKDCCDRAGNLNSLKSQIAVCFDMAPDGMHASLAAAAVRPDGRVQVEIAGVWPSSDVARQEMPALLAKIGPAAIGFYPSGPGGALSPMLRKLETHSCAVHELTGMKVAEACQGLADLTQARRIVHPGQAILDEHVGGAQKLPTADGWRFTRRYRNDKNIAHCDAAYACAGAVYVALSMPEPRIARVRSFAVSGGTPPKAPDLNRFFGDGLFFVDGRVKAPSGKPCPGPEGALPHPYGKEAGAGIIAARISDQHPPLRSRAVSQTDSAAAPGKAWRSHAVSRPRARSNHASADLPRERRPR